MAFGFDVRTFELQQRGQRSLLMTDLFGRGLWTATSADCCLPARGWFFLPAYDFKPETGLSLVAAMETRDGMCCQ